MLYQVLFIIIVAIFGAILVFNIFFRVKIFKQYKYLVKNQIDFDTKHFFSKEKMEKEIYPKYPAHREEIDRFVRMIHQSIQIASILIICIIILGFILLKFS